MAWHRYGTLVIVGFWFMAFLCATGCGRQATATFMTVGSSIGATASSEKPKPTTPDKPAAFTIDTAAWSQDWKKDTDAARNKYAGKTIQLSGTVNEASTSEFSGDGAVSLEVDDPTRPIVCHTFDKEPWTKVLRGSTIKIKGVCPDAGPDACLRECVIVEAGPYPAMSISATKLAADCVADFESTKQKYHEKVLIVDGEVTAKDLTGAYVFFLKGKGDLRVECEFGRAYMQEAQAKSVKIGQTIKVYGDRCSIRKDDQTKRKEIQVRCVGLK